VSSPAAGDWRVICAGESRLLQTQLDNSALVGYSVTTMVKVRARHLKSQTILAAGLYQQSGVSCMACLAQRIAGFQCMQQTGRCFPP
jgi:hypothetical protein